MYEYIPTISTDSTGFFYNNTKLTDWKSHFPKHCALKAAVTCPTFRTVFWINWLECHIFRFRIWSESQSRPSTRPVPLTAQDAWTNHCRHTDTQNVSQDLKSKLQFVSLFFVHFCTLLALNIELFNCKRQIIWTLSLLVNEH